MSVVKEDGTYDYIDNQPTVPVGTEEAINEETQKNNEEIKSVNINEL